MASCQAPANSDITWRDSYASPVLSNLLRAFITRQIHTKHKPFVNWILISQL